MRPSSNTSAVGDQLVAVRTGMEAPEITLECYSGHITLVEFVNLRPAIIGQPAEFADAFRTKIYNMIEDVAQSWECDERLRLKAGWVGENLLLIGFEQQLSLKVADQLMASLTKAFMKVHTIRFNDQTNTNTHEVYLNKVKPVYSMVTKPKIMPYQNLASILINDVQSKKSTNRTALVCSSEQYSSAIWANKPTTSVVSPLSIEEQREINYQENTRRFLRKAFREHHINLMAKPVVNLATHEWESITVMGNGLSSMVAKTGLNYDTLSSVAESLGMIWELDTGTLDQALHEMKRILCKSTPEPYRVNVPIALETVMCWSRFQSDLIDVLNGYDADLVGKLRIVITGITDIIGVMDNQHVAALNEWLAGLKADYGIEFFARWENLENHQVTFQPLQVDGIALSCNTCNDIVLDRLESVIRSRNRYSKDLTIILADHFPAEAAVFAGDQGAELAEVRDADKGGSRAFSEMLLKIQYRNKEDRSSSGVVDARRRFRATETQ